SRQEGAEGTSSVLSALSGSAKRIVILAPTPTLKFDGPGCLARLQWRRWTMDENSRCVSPAADEHREMIKSALSAAALMYLDVEVLDFENAICPLASCAAEVSGLLVYRDRQHLTADYMETLAHRLGDSLGIGRRAA